MTLTLLLGLLVVAAAVYAVVRRIDVRLALTLAAFALGALAGRPELILQTFLATLADEQFVVPICTAMAFAFVLRHTGCDRHLVALLSAPVRRVRPLLVPGTVLVGATVNVTIISQASTLVTVGPVLVPLLRAAGVPPLTAAAALLLGASLGGELLNPGAPELQTVSAEASRVGPAVTPTGLVGRVAPLVAIHLAVTVAVFWALSARRDRRQPAPEEKAKAEEAPERVNVVKALVPLLPVVLLFLTGPPLGPWPVPRSWLAADDDRAAKPDSRLIGAAMLVGVAAAALTAGRAGLGCARAFFDGAGHGYTQIISVIVAARSFGRGVELLGLAEVLGRVTAAAPGLLAPAEVLLPLAFAWVCGSGFAATTSLYPFYVGPCLAAGADLAEVGALVSLSSAAGRTMSPVAAVTLLAAELNDVEPAALVKRVAGPLFVGLGVVLLVRLVL
jgi:DcuC family C4-dicarboxylate transporter